MIRTFEANITFRITDACIDDIMACALEGGITYWCSKVDVVGEYLGEFASDQISLNGELLFYLDEPFDKENTKCYTLNYSSFIRGVAQYLEYDMSILFDREVNAIEIDADIADQIIQYALFGEVVFG